MFSVDDDTDAIDDHDQDDAHDYHDDPGQSQLMPVGTRSMLGIYRMQQLLLGVLKTIESGFKALRQWLSRPSWNSTSIAMQTTSGD